MIKLKNILNEWDARKIKTIDIWFEDRRSRFIEQLLMVRSEFLVGIVGEMLKNHYLNY